MIKRWVWKHYRLYVLSRARLRIECKDGVLLDTPLSTLSIVACQDGTGTITMHMGAWTVACQDGTGTITMHMGAWTISYRQEAS